MSIRDLVKGGTIMVEHIDESFNQGTHAHCFQDSHRKYGNDELFLCV